MINGLYIISIAMYNESTMRDSLVDVKVLLENKKAGR